MGNVKEIALGTRFGNWEVLGKGTPMRGRTMWRSRCKCGAIHDLSGSALRGGRTKSCQDCNRTRHGKARTRVYRIWQLMRDRVKNPNAPNYHLYGARGIGISIEWESSFEKFYADMGDPPQGTSLDRKDNNKGYSKDNCRWATPKEQARNMRTNRVVEFNGYSRCVSEWAEHLGISKTTLSKRLKRWPLDKALTLPKQC